MVTIAAMLSVENIFITPRRSKPNPAAKNSKSQPNPTRNSKLKLNLSVYGYSDDYQGNSYSGGKGSSNSYDDIQAERAELAHSQLRHRHGDHYTLLAVFNHWEENNNSYQWCEKNFINFRPLRTAKKIR